MISGVRTQGRFLQHGDRRVFALDVAPATVARGAVLYVPPFAEEMNRLRSHAAAQARVLAAGGLHCQLLDLQGTGESEGLIEDASWDLWLDDVCQAARRLGAVAAGPLTLWGVRTGALLAAEAARQLGDQTVQRLLFWQPVIDGKLFLSQYLRLRVASQMVADGARETTDMLRTRLRDGEVVEVAGYPLSGAMADSLERRQLATLAPPASTLVGWVEVTAQAGQEPGLPAQKVIAAWRDAGVRVTPVGVKCPMVWQVHEPVAAPELRSASAEAMVQA